MDVPAKHWERAKSFRVQCKLCPHECLISVGGKGKCLIRQNHSGKLYQTAYAEPCSLSIDPIEKKPLYHFYPSRNILSVGTNGCNMSCHFCQNWQISTQETRRDGVTADRLLKLSTDNNSIGIAYTYNEPIIWYEFVYDCAKVFREAGQKNVMVTNGQINEEPLAELLPFIDAMNIDLKGFTEEFYKNEGGYLQTTLNTIKAAHKAGTHIELTNLVIPELNDNETTFEEMCRFIAGISKDIPLHLSRHFPQYKSEKDITSEKLLLNLKDIAGRHLNYVYIGNAQIDGASDTYCPECHAKIIERTGYKTTCLTDDNICKNCSTSLSLHF